MRSEKEYQILFNKYNRLDAAHSDTTQQLIDKSSALRELERTSKISLGLTRALCKEILAKDPNEMVLGCSYSWDSIDINSLIEKSVQVFRRYNDDRTSLMRRLYRQIEENMTQLDGLKSQIESMQINAVNRVTSQEDDENDTGEVTPDTAVADALSLIQPKAISKAPYKMQQAVATGQIEAIIEEETDVGEKDLVDIQEAISLAKALDIQRQEIPVHPAKQKIAQRQENEKKRQEAYMVDLNTTKEQMTAIEWVILDTIAAYGLSQFPLIEEKAQEIWRGAEADNPDSRLSHSRIRIGLQKLINLQVIQQEHVATPFVSKLAVYSLAPMGAHLYKVERKKSPVLSERDQIVAEHDNVDHGYGIKAIHEMFEESGYYRSVCSSAQKNRVPLDGGIAYVPDIVAADERFKNYFEYERGKHNQPNFNAKMNKACKVTSHVHFVVPNKQVLSKVVHQVEEWIASRGGRKSLTGKKVRIATAQFLRGQDPRQDNSWNYVFDMKNDLPVINTVEKLQAKEPAVHVDKPADRQSEYPQFRTAKKGVII